MLLFVLTVLLTVVVASAVVVYVAFPHRGHDVPSAPWLGRLMRRGVALLPTLDNRTPDGGVRDGWTPEDEPGDLRDGRRDDVRTSAPWSR